MTHTSKDENILLDDYADAPGRWVRDNKYAKILAGAEVTFDTQLWVIPQK